MHKIIGLLCYCIIRTYNKTVLNILPCFVKWISVQNLGLYLLKHIHTILYLYRGGLRCDTVQCGWHTGKKTSKSTYPKREKSNTKVSAVSRTGSVLGADYWPR
jgi:hypothetical protein